MSTPTELNTQVTYHEDGAIEFTSYNGKQLFIARKNGHLYEIAHCSYPIRFPWVKDRFFNSASSLHLLAEIMDIEAF